MNYNGLINRSTIGCVKCSRTELLCETRYKLLMKLNYILLFIPYYLFRHLKLVCLDFENLVFEFIFCLFLCINENISDMLL